jgi:hypothetical protein
MISTAAVVVRLPWAWMTLNEAIRELARLARRKDLRISKWTRERPCEWRPYEVENPESGLPFTEVRAWEYIAELLESGQAVTEVELQQPPGELGYEMVIALKNGQPDLYIKVQFLGGRILGRSFHYSHE